MDPLSALSVAAAVVQFAEYGTGIVSNAHELYKSTSGALSENIDLGVTAARLQTLSGNLQELQRRGKEGREQGPFEQNEQVLGSICEDCVEISEDLVERLSKLRVSEDSKHKRLSALKQAVKTVWSKEKIQETVEKLANLRNELNAHIPVSLRYVQQSGTKYLSRS